MKVRINILVISLICTFSASSQNTLFHSNDSLRINLSIGKASDNQFTKSEGAEIIGTFPENDSISNSWLTNAYLEFGMVSDSTHWSIGLVGEIHRNTLVEKKQHVEQLGVKLGKIIAFKDKKTGASNFEIPITIGLKQSKDFVKNTTAFQGTLGMSFNKFKGTPLLKTQTAFPKFNSGFGRILQFSHNHNSGLSYLGGNENVYLGQFDFEINTYFLPTLSDKLINKKDLFKLQFKYSGRTELFGKTDLDLNSLISFQTGVNLTFNKKNSLELVYVWNQGANPLKGLENQKYESLIVKVKVFL